MGCRTESRASKAVVGATTVVATGAMTTVQAGLSGVSALVSSGWEEKPKPIGKKGRARDGRPATTQNAQGIRSPTLVSAIDRPAQASSYSHAETVINKDVSPKKKFIIKLKSRL